MFSSRVYHVTRNIYIFFKCIISHKCRVTNVRACRFVSLFTRCCTVIGFIILSRSSPSAALCAQYQLGMFARGICVFGYIPVFNGLFCDAPSLLSTARGVSAVVYFRMRNRVRHRRRVWREGACTRGCLCI